MNSKEDGVKRRNKKYVNPDSKRVKKNEDSSEEDMEMKPICKYGEKCYQKNSYHLKNFRHPHRESEAKHEEEFKDESSKLEPTTNEQITEESPAVSTTYSESKGEEINTTADSKGDQLLSANDDRELPPTPLDIKENIKQKFLLEMPDDFYQLWEFSLSICPEKPLETFTESLGLKLVGPFELLDKSSEKKPRKFSYLTQWRFYYDPPEFQCVMIGDISKGYHIGYFRDDPKEDPAFVGSNTESEGCVLTPINGNLFSSLCHLLSMKIQKADPFQKSRLATLKKQLEDWASNNDISMESHNQFLKDRKKKMVMKTFYGCGVVVPYNKKTKVGYREIPESDANIKKICRRIVESSDETERDKNSDALQELVTYVQYANDESDYGMGLELGLDLLAFGGEEFHSTILHLLGVAYELLERQEFLTILKEHLKERHKLAVCDTD